MSRIRVLPAALRDQIAAGEVVERPSSVVKELIENALDAGARTLRVEVDGGGLDRILVVDDGAGMTGEEALLALERHATSKLAEFDDLYRLSTFGFRGEALPSIAAVSRLTLTTRPADALAATQVEVVGGQAPTMREVGAPAGTTFLVRELFFNVPARRKFLKSVGTESGHVGDVCLDMALSRPDLALTLVRDGRTARQFLRAQSREERARDVLSRPGESARATTADFVAVANTRGRTRVEAVLSVPERARSGATGLHLLVNGRAIRDRALARAVAMAYGSVLDPGRYPLGVVWVDLPSEEVDVNVHPQKAEVRFSRGRELLDDVTRALAAVLADVFRSPASTFLASERVSDLFPGRPPQGSAGATTLVGHGVPRPTVSMSQAVTRAHSFGEDPWGLGVASLGDPALPSTELDEPATRLEAGPMSASRAAESAPPLAPLEHTRVSGKLQTTLQSADAIEAAANAARGEIAYGRLRFLAQVRATYLVCEADEGIYVIDQHAAAERLNFARLRAQHDARKVARQQLLVPEVAEVSSAESELVDETRDEMLALGLDARALGDGRVAVHAVPALLAKASPLQLLRDLLDELARSGGRKFGDAVDLVLATMACHGSVRAGDAMHPDECRALLSALDEVSFAGYCPHGRPIVTMLSYQDLEKRVGRR